jgi:ribosomal protein S25
MSTVAPEVQEAHALLQSRREDLASELLGIDLAIEALPLNGNRPTKRSPGRPKKAAATATKASAGKTPTGRKKRSGTRADEAVKLIAKEPGISASEIAKRMKIKPNYLYRVLGELEKEGRVKKDGRSYTAV